MNNIDSCYFFGVKSGLIFFGQIRKGGFLSVQLAYKGRIECDENISSEAAISIFQNNIDSLHFYRLQVQQYMGPKWPLSSVGPEF